MLPRARGENSDIQNGAVHARPRPREAGEITGIPVANIKFECRFLIEAKRQAGPTFQLVGKSAGSNGVECDRHANRLNFNDGLNWPGGMGRQK